MKVVYMSHALSIELWINLLVKVGIDRVKDGSLPIFVQHFKTSIVTVFFQFINQESENTSKIQIILTLIIILLTIVIQIFLKESKTSSIISSYYSVNWKKSSSLKPEDVLGIRAKRRYGFNEYYYPREHDKLIKEKIEEEENVLVIGNPLAGKTRAVFQTLKKLEEPYNVIIPRPVDVNPEDFIIPRRFSSRRKTILILDDINKFIEKQNFMFLLQAFLKLDTIIVASCRSGPEYDIVCNKMEKELTLFGNPIEISSISREEGESVAKVSGGELPAEFDGNIGSIFVPLNTMRDRFAQSSEEEKFILRTIKNLYFAGLYREREVFSIERIKTVYKDKYELEKKKHEWIELFNELKNRGFIEVLNNDVSIEEAYIEFVIQDGFDILDNLIEMKDIFSDDFEALISIGNQAQKIGLIDIRKVKFLWVAIGAYRDALKVRTLKGFPMQYAMTQNNLGNAYNTLADVEGKAENCREAIGAYREALKVYTLEDFPMDYAMTQNNLGAAYQTLAEVEDKDGNCREAIRAFEEALKVYTLEGFPMDYAMTQNNLGTAYGTLADVEDKAGNCREAIRAFEEALKVYTLEGFPMQYATTQNNLGAAYQTLAEVEDKAGNCKRALEAFRETLRVVSKEKHPEIFIRVISNVIKTMQFCENEVA